MVASFCAGAAVAIGYGAARAAADVRVTSVPVSLALLPILPSRFPECIPTWHIAGWQALNGWTSPVPRVRSTRHERQ